MNVTIIKLGNAYIVIGRVHFNLNLSRTLKKYRIECKKKY